MTLGGPPRPDNCAWKRTLPSVCAIGNEAISSRVRLELN